MYDTSRTIFISDLHLEESSPKTTQIFLEFLRKLDTKNVDAVYILGDLFEAWVGDDDETLLHKQIISVLQSVTLLGVPIYFLCGNRDFLIGKKFIAQSGCRLIPDETIINLYGESVLIMHGDTLCTQDTGYLRARKLLRNPFLQKLFLHLPLAIRKKIANAMRRASRQYTASANPAIMDASQTAVESVMQKHQVNFLIHGHTHRPRIHEFLLDHKKAERIVLGAWHEQGSMLIWNAEGNKQLMKL